MHTIGKIGVSLNDSPSGNWALVAANYNSVGPIFTAENIANPVRSNQSAVVRDKPTTSEKTR